MFWKASTEGEYLFSSRSFLRSIVMHFCALYAFTSRDRGVHDIRGVVGKRSDGLAVIFNDAFLTLSPIAIAYIIQEKQILHKITSRERRSTSHSIFKKLDFMNFVSELFSLLLLLPLFSRVTSHNQNSS